MIALVAGLGAASAVAEDQPTVENPEILLAITVGGAIAMVLGLVYASVRSVVHRRWLPPERYRGPPPIVLLVLALVSATALQLPFTAELVEFQEGGTMSRLASLVTLTSLQLALLAVAALFVAWPRALAGVPPLDGEQLGRSIAVGLRWGVVAWLVATALGALVVAVFEQLGLPAEPQVAEQALAVLDPVIAVLALVVLAPIAEEIFFRGVVYNAWKREHGVWIATIGSSLLFAVIHLSPVQVLPIFVLGLVLARTYERTRSLIAAMLIHAVVNGISVTFGLLVRYEVISLPT